MSSATGDALLVTGILVGVAGSVAVVFVKKIQRERVIYWSSWLLAGSLMASSVMDRGWRAVALAAGVCAGGALMYAYLRTPYVKIRGRIFTFTLAQNISDPTPDGSAPPHPRRPPDAYGNFLTAPKYWWTIAAFSATAALLAIIGGMTGVTITGFVFCAAFLAFTGYIDAYEGFPVGRRQHMQMSVIVLASVPLFLGPPLC